MHRVLGVETVHLFELRPMYSLLAALAGQTLLLRLQVAEKWSLSPSRDDRRCQRAQLRSERVTVNQLVIRREQQEEDCRIPLERQTHPFTEAVDGQVEIAGYAPCVVTPLTLGRRPVDKLLERSPERHRGRERLDAHAHLVAVLDPIVHVE